MNQPLEATFTNAHLAHMLGDDDMPERLPYSCWECGEDCAELTQAPWTAQRLLIGTCCQPITVQRENVVTAAELAAEATEELALFGTTSRAFQALEQDAAFCACRQTDAELFSPRGCEVHDPNSRFNVRLRAVTSVQMFEEREVA
jgi:hypothetical protein